MKGLLRDEPVTASLQVPLDLCGVFLLSDNLERLKEWRNEVGPNLSDTQLDVGCK